MSAALGVLPGPAFATPIIPVTPPTLDRTAMLALGTTFVVLLGAMDAPVLVRATKLVVDEAGQFVKGEAIRWIAGLLAAGVLALAAQIETAGAAPLPRAEASALVEPAVSRAGRCLPAQCGLPQGDRPAPRRARLAGAQPCGRQVQSYPRRH